MKIKFDLIKYSEEFNWTPYFWNDDHDIICFGWLWWNFEIERYKK